MKDIRIETILKVCTYIIVAIGYLSVAARVGVVYSAGFVLVSVASIYLTRRRIFVPRWVLNSAIITVFAISALQVTVDNIVVPAIEVLLILIALKLLEEHRARDYMQIYTLSLFLLAASALLSTDMIFMAFFVGLTVILTVVLVLLAYFGEDPRMVLSLTDARRIIAWSLTIPLIVIPLTALFFLILPRTDYPLFDFLNKKDVAASGFSDSVELGAVSEIQEDDTVAFRAVMGRIDDPQLYWRGIVFDFFDGRTWQRRERRRTGKRYRTIPGGEPVNYRIYLEASDNTYLITLDKPAYLSLGRVTGYRDLIYEFDEAPRKRIRYDAMSVLSPVIDDDDGAVESIYLQLPRNLGNIEGLVRDLTAGKTGDGAVLGALYSFLTGGSFRYSLTSLVRSPVPLDDFLFAHRSGNCEYFASAMAVMLRIAGIPARVVGGYRGGYYNAMGGYFAVPQKNAHVWVEAFLPQRGWLRVDPTPAAVDGFMAPDGRSLRFRLMIAVDIIRYYWTVFVINYDFQKQVNLLSNIGSTLELSSRAINYRNIAIGAALILFLVVIVYALIMVRRTRKLPSRRILRAFLKKMEARGYRKEPWEGLQEFVARMEEKDVAEGAGRFVRTFEGLFYRDRALTHRDRDILKALLRKIDGQD